MARGTKISEFLKAVLPEIENKEWEIPIIVKDDNGNWQNFRISSEDLDEYISDEIPDMVNLYNSDGFLTANRNIDLRDRTLSLFKNGTSVTPMVRFDPVNQRVGFGSFGILKTAATLDTTAGGTQKEFYEFFQYNSDPMLSFSRIFGIAGAENAMMFGKNAGRGTIGYLDSTIAIGAEALYKGRYVNNSYIQGSLAIGNYAGRNSLGYGNIFLGRGAGDEYGLLTTAASDYPNHKFNIAIGDEAGKRARGKENVLLGWIVGYEVNGNSNTMLGNQCGQYSTGSGNIFIGRSGILFQGSNNIHIGRTNNGNSTVKDNTITIGKIAPTVSGQAIWGDTTTTRADIYGVDVYLRGYTTAGDLAIDAGGKVYVKTGGSLMKKGTFVERTFLTGMAFGDLYYQTDESVGLFEYSPRFSKWLFVGEPRIEYIDAILGGSFPLEAKHHGRHIYFDLAYFGMSGTTLPVPILEFVAGDKFRISAAGHATTQIINITMPSAIINIVYPTGITSLAQLTAAGAAYTFDLEFISHNTVVISNYIKRAI